MDTYIVTRQEVDKTFYCTELMRRMRISIGTSWRVTIKEIFDFCLAAIGLVVLSPLFALVAVAIKIDSPGAVLYKQARVGKDGRVFQIVKFRTMVQDAEKGTGAVWAKTNDPRITKLGAFLRKTHIDELTQLFNVIKGDMSLVGPRPERPEIVSTLRKQVTNYSARLAVKPGITGLAQIRHKYDETIEDVRKKVKYDIFYINEICLLVDLRIIVNTARYVFTGTSVR